MGTYIHKEEPMYAVLDKVTIKSEIMPCLSTAKRGFETKSCLIEIINAILYRLKTGCQWKHLPDEALFTEPVHEQGAVFHHFNNWRKAGELPIIMSAPKSGEHNDIHDIENVIKAMF